MHCIIEAMLARSSDVVLMKPQIVDVPHFMLGDSDRLRGILLNLYTNAAKFTRTGAAPCGTSKMSHTNWPRAVDVAYYL